MDRTEFSADPARDSAVTVTADSTAEAVCVSESMIGSNSRRIMRTNRHRTAIVTKAVVVDSTATIAKMTTEASLTSPSVNLPDPVHFV